jgi:hypothetical protein
MIPKFSEYQEIDSFETYLKNMDFNSSSDIKNIAKSPAHYEFNRARILKGDEPTDALTRGSLVHAMILEPVEVETRYLHFTKDMLPFPDRAVTFTPNKEEKVRIFEEAVKNEKVVVSDKVWEEACGMRDIVKQNKKAMELLEGTYSEISFYTMFDLEGHSVKLKCRPDAMSKKNYMVSLKTTRDITPRGFEYESYKFGYHTSEYFYKYVLNAVLKEEYRIETTYMIVISNPTKEPPMSRVYDLSLIPEYFSVGESYFWLGIYKYLDYIMNKEEYSGQGYDLYNNDVVDGVSPLYIPESKSFEIEMVENLMSQLKIKLKL